MQYRDIHFFKELTKEQEESLNQKKGLPLFILDAIICIHI